MTIEQLQEKRTNIAEGIKTLREQAAELEIAIRRNEGALLMVEHLLAEMGEDEPNLVAKPEPPAS